MKLQHCQKCGVQIEFMQKKNPRAHSDKCQMNRLEAGRRSKSATVTEFYYCNDCFSEMESLLQEKGFLPPGIGDGFDGQSD